MAAESGAEVLVEAALSLRSQGRVALCQIVRTEGSTPGKVGWKMLARPDGTFCGNLGGGAFEALVQADASRLLAGADLGAGGGQVKRYYLTEQAVRGEPTGMVCGGMVEVFLEVIAAAPVLVVCGGGPVGQALARAAGLAGFEPLVAEDREVYRRPELFPQGTLLAAVDREYSQDFLAPVGQRELYVTVVSRCWETDCSALAAVLRQAPGRLRYLGLMGSRRKVERVREELGRRGVELGGVALRSPIGLPIGGDSPGEIAISILAEVIGTRHDSSPPA
jgi:xanthine dehydrogenase accessory factor